MRGGTHRVPPRTGFGGGASALDEARDKQQDHRADQGVDHLGDVAAADENAKARQKPAGDDCADDADHDIADQSEPPALHDLTGEPAGDGTDDEPDNDDFRRHESILPRGPRALCDRPCARRPVMLGASGGCRIGTLPRLLVVCQQYNVRGPTG